MKISPASQSPKSMTGFRSRALKFRDFLCALQRLPGLFSEKNKPAGHFSAVGPANVFENPVQAGELSSAAPVVPETFEAGVVNLAHKIGQAAQRAVSTERVVVSFNTGCFQGVTCVVNLQGQTVRCRFRSQGAVARKLLGEARKTVAGHLKASGFELGDYEVGS